MDADDLRAAGLPDARAAGAAAASCRRGWTGWSRRGTRCSPGSPRSTTGGSSRPTRRSTACRIDPRATYIVVARHPSTWPSRSTTRAPTSTASASRELTGAAGADRATRGPGRRCASGCGGWIDWDADPRTSSGLAARRDVAPVRRVGPPRTSRTSCSSTTTTCPPTSTGEMRRLAASPRHRRARGPLARAGAGGDVRRHARPGAAPRARPGGHLKDRGRVLPARDVRRRRGGPEPGGAGPLPRAGGRAGVARGPGLAPPRPPRRRRIRGPGEAPRRTASAEGGGQLEAGVAVGRAGVVELDRDDVRSPARARLAGR